MSNEDQDHTTQPTDDATDPELWTLSFQGRYKSIGDLTWPDVPPFAIVTGENGAGKSHLLEAIHNGISSHGSVSLNQHGHIVRSSGPFSFLNAKEIFDRREMQIASSIEKDRITSREAEIQRRENQQELDKNTWKGQILNISGVLRFVDSERYGPPVEGELRRDDVVIVKDAFQALDIDAERVPRHDVTRLAQLMSNDRILKSRAELSAGHEFRAELERSGISEPRYSDLVRYASSNPGKLIRVDNPLYGVTEAFRVYRKAMLLYLEERFLSTEEDGEDYAVWRSEPEAALGTPPWKLLNETLRAAGFDFRVTTPLSRDDAEDFIPEFTQSGVAIDAKHLSSGEKTMVGIVCALYTSETGGQLPRMLLLDEPDAHLHPSLTRQLLNVLRDVLVETHGVRVIMTTHSPSTVALAPDNSVFVLSRNPRVIEQTDKWEAASVLTAGITAVGPERKSVFVEDIDDEAFYRVTAEIAESSSLEHEMRVPPGRLSFIPSSRGRGDRPLAAGGGGWTVVKRFIEDIGGTHIRGLIDLDSGLNETEGNQRIHVLGRYSIENYLIDPLVLYVHSSRTEYKEGRRLRIDGFELTKGMEAEITSKPQNELQELVDHVTGALFTTIQAENPELVSAKDLVDVAWTSGQILHYPKWMLTSPGKSIKGYLPGALGGLHYHFESFLSSYGILRALPVELVRTLQRIARA